MKGVFTYRSHADEAQKVAEEIEALGVQAAALPLDVGDSSQFAAFAQQLTQTLQRVWQRDRFDFLVNNAGHDCCCY
ncbi:hypothetical protein CRX72_28165 [Pantoea sp. BRM17]|nr:hypothetical protein CRX72_28165 [Pantoea sp. BRM17]